MLSYSHTEVFSQAEINLLAQAIKLVDAVKEGGSVIRCHELARAVGRVLDLPVEDGYYGFVDHSWCWTRPVDRRPPTPRIGWPNILDVYCVGQLPMVQLVASEPSGLPHVGWAYRTGPKREDIRWDVAGELQRQMVVSLRQPRSLVCDQCGFEECCSEGMADHVCRRRGGCSP